MDMELRQSDGDEPRSCSAVCKTRVSEPTAISTATRPPSCKRKRGRFSSFRKLLSSSSFEETDGIFKRGHFETTQGNGHLSQQTDSGKEKLQSGLLVPRVYPRRWAMVFLFASYSMSNAYQWIHINIIGNVVIRYYNESLPGETTYQKQVAIDWLSMLYMVAYIPLIVPVNWLLNKHGLRVVAIVGTMLNCIGAWLKCAAISPDRFWLLIIAQTICATAQVFILGIPALLSAVWFGIDEVSTATAIGVFGNQAGCALGFLIPPEIVPDSPDLDDVGHNLGIMFYSGAAVTSALFLLVLIVFKKKPPVPPSPSMAAIVENRNSLTYTESLVSLFKNPGFVLLVISYGVNTGCYYAIGTLLNPFVIEHFPGEGHSAGRIGLTIVLAGVLGSILGGIWLDKTKRFKSTAVGIYALTLLGMVAYTFILDFSPHIWPVFICGGLLGFFMTGYLPVGFEFAAEITYPISEGTSIGLLNASAQIFGIIFTLSQGFLKESSGTLAANILLSVVLLLGTIMTAAIKSDMRRQAAAKQHDDDMAEMVAAD